MKKLLLSVSALLALSACSAPVANLKNQEHDQRRAARARAVEQLYSPTCPAPANLKAGNCGFMEQGFTEAETAKLDACRGGHSADCDDAFRQLVVARWQTRYPKADAAKVGAWCAENPKQCDNLGLAELQWMDSHNRHVIAELQRETALIKQAAAAQVKEESLQPQRSALAANQSAMAASAAASSAMMASQASAMAASQAAMMATPPPPPALH